MRNSFVQDDLDTVRLYLKEVYILCILLVASEEIQLSLM